MPASVVRAALGVARSDPCPRGVRRVRIRRSSDIRLVVGGFVRDERSSEIMVLDTADLAFVKPRRGLASDGIGSGGTSRHSTTDASADHRMRLSTSRSRALSALRLRRTRRPTYRRSPSSSPRRSSSDGSGASPSVVPRRFASGSPRARSRLRTSPNTASAFLPSGCSSFGITQIHQTHESTSVTSDRRSP